MRRPIVTLLLAGLAASLLAAPASAATVRVVDDDGKGSAASCDSPAKAYKKVQAAVNAASAGDTVLVCPGIYDEQVVIVPGKDGLRLRGVGHWTAVIAPSAPEAKSEILSVLADRVTVSRLRIRYATSRPPVAGACDFLTAGIAVDGDDARIRGNLVEATGPGRLGCGLVAGIRVSTEDGPSPSGVVSYNVVKDFSTVGIVGNGTGLRVTVFRNIIRFHHKGLTPSPRRRAPGRLAPAGTRDILAPGFGILIPTGSTGVIRENTVEGSLPGRGPLSGGPDALYVGSGIEIGSGDIEVRANRVYRAQGGIVTSDDGLPALAVSGPTITENLSVAAEYGIYLQGDGALVEGNQAQANAAGVWAFETSASNVITGNELRSNGTVDCQDATGPDAGSVANTWSDNLALTDSPSGICVPVAP